MKNLCCRDRREAQHYEAHIMKSLFKELTVCSLETHEAERVCHLQLGLCLVTPRTQAKHELASSEGRKGKA